MEQSCISRHSQGTNFSNQSSLRYNTTLIPDSGIYWVREINQGEAATTTTA